MSIAAPLLGPRLQRVVIVGAGLIGTSIGLALTAADISVTLYDRDPATADLAAELGAGKSAGRWPPESIAAAAAAAGSVDVVIAAVPPAQVAEVLAGAYALKIGRVYMHVASVQTKPLVDIQASEIPIEQFVGTHPMAGSERGGPASGSGSLFQDRVWVICPTAASTDSVAAAAAVIDACGANRVTMTPARHDAAVAAVSAVPQLVSSALAATLVSLDDEAVAIAGGGIRDTTRLAVSDPSLWSEIVAANADEVARALGNFMIELEPLIASREAISPAAVDLLTRGQIGRDRLGGKHGQRARHWATVEVAIGDRPGAMLDVLTVCRDTGINVEDLWLEHAQGQPTGVLHLQVDPADTGRLVSALEHPALTVIGVQAPHE